MFYILFSWQIVAMAHAQTYAPEIEYAWVNQGKYYDEAECSETARLLKLKQFRCIPTKNLN